MIAAVVPHHSTGYQRRALTRAILLRQEQLLEGIRRRHGVVVHKPNRFGASRQGVGKTCRKTSRPSGVDRQLVQPNSGKALADHLRGAIGGCVVDDVNLISHLSLIENGGQRMMQQVSSVVGHDDGMNYRHLATLDH